jgi:hypothetical protein
MELEKELKYFESIKQDLLAKQHEGKFALIKGEKLFDTFSRSEDAYAEGVKRFGKAPFLIKQVLREDRTEHIPADSLGVLNARL